MALARALTAVRTGVLSHVRVSANLGATQQQASPATWQFVRGFAGTYLDKNDVTERVLNVVKHFDKIDQSKASTLTPQSLGEHAEKCCFQFPMLVFGLFLLAGGKPLTV